MSVNARLRDDGAHQHGWEDLGTGKAERQSGWTHEVVTPALQDGCTPRRPCGKR